MASTPDVRGIGFAELAPLAEAWVWVDAVAPLPGAETAPPAAGRVLAADVIAPADLPPADRAAIDGYAVRAADTEGASAYNPLPLARAEAVTGGAPMPAGCDAVLGFAAVCRATSGQVEVLEQAAQGEGVLAKGAALRAGTVALAAGHRLRPLDLALLAMLGIGRAVLRCRPLVRVVIAGPKQGEAEALGAMLEALIGRDGGVAERALLGAPGTFDAVLLAGRSGAGEDDDAAARLGAGGGALALHGVALRPGGSAGLGRLGTAPVALLPGEPVACRVAYDMLASRLVRRLAGFQDSRAASPSSFPRKACPRESVGREPRAASMLPHPWVPAFAGMTGSCPRIPMKLGRKIVSAIGLTDVVPVAIADETVAPVAPGLPAACRADGFVVVPETLEGFAEGETVEVCLYDPP